ncbi:MAG: hypothetical protein SchgKO_23920 [Schleiferiaceae bacterium]
MKKFYFIFSGFIMSFGLMAQTTIGTGATIINSAGATITTPEMAISGTYTSGEGSLVVDGNFTVAAAGTFTRGTGSVQLQGSSTPIITKTGGGTISFYTLIFDATAGETIESGTTVNVSNTLTFATNHAGTFTTNDNLVLEATNTDIYATVGVNSASLPTISGKTTVEKVMANTNSGWRQMGFPFSETSIASLNFNSTLDLITDGSGQNNMYTWNGNATAGAAAPGWEVPSTVGEEFGYTIYSNNSNGGIHDISSTVRVTGTLNLADVSVSLYDTDDPQPGVGSPINDGTEQGWNLISNPYPARLVMSNVFTKLGNASVSYQGVHLWSTSVGQYFAHTNGVSVIEYGGTNSTNQGSDGIKSLGAFWVKTDGGNSKSLSLSFKDDTSPTPSSGDPDYNKSIPSQFQINVFDPDSLWDGVKVYYDIQASHQFDDKYDGYKLFSTRLDVPTLYAAEENLRTSIVAHPSSTMDSIPMMFSSQKKTSGFYLNLQDQDLEAGHHVYVKDHYTQAVHDLTQLRSVGFTHTSMAPMHRFTLFVDGSGVDLDEVGKDSSISAFTTSDEWVILLPALGSENLNIEVFEISGKKVVSWDSNFQTEIRKPLDELQSGLYLMVISNRGKNLLSQKMNVVK